MNRLCLSASLLLVLMMTAVPAYSSDGNTICVHQDKFPVFDQEAIPNPLINKGTKHFILPHPFDVRKYILELTPDLGSGYLSATVTIECRSGADFLEEVQFNFVGDWDITAVRVDDVGVQWDHDGKVLSVDFPSPANNGDKFSVRVSYQGFPANDPAMGLRYYSFYMDGYYGHTFSQPYQARYWFPCFDEPSDKAEEGCETIVTVPGRMKVASNGMLVSTRYSGSQAIFHWRHEYPIATYLISVAVGTYDVIEWSAGEIPVVVYTYPHAYSATYYDFGRTPEMLQYFSRVFGDYPFEKYGTVVVPSESGYAMEHQTMTHWSERLLTGDRRYESVVAHELAHQWWGDSVTLADYRDIWLNEGFADYSEVIWWEQAAGPAIRDQIIETYRRQYLEEDAEDRFSIYRTDYDLRRMFSRTTYQKAALVLHMLRWEVGDEDFYEGLREYYRRHAYGTVTTPDFIDAMEDVSGRELDDFFQGWIYGAGYPEYEVSSYYTKLDGQLKSIVTVHQAQSDPTVFAMSLPLDPDGEGQMPAQRRYVSGSWAQFEFDVPNKVGKAEIKQSNWLLMTTACGDYPEPSIKGVRKKRLKVGQTHSVTIVGRGFTPVSQVKLSSKNISIESLKADTKGKRIYVDLVVPDNHKARTIDLTVINPDGDKAEKKQAFRIVQRRKK